MAGVLASEDSAGSLDHVGGAAAKHEKRPGL
jgi:hypothetical protein